MSKSLKEFTNDELSLLAKAMENEYEVKKQQILSLWNDLSDLEERYAQCMNEISNRENNA